jgi:hypothetical protein
MAKDADVKLIPKGGSGPAVIPKPAQTGPWSKPGKQSSGTSKSGCASYGSPPGGGDSRRHGHPLPHHEPAAPSRWTTPR